MNVIIGDTVYKPIDKYDYLIIPNYVLSLYV